MKKTLTAFILLCAMLLSLCSCTQGDAKAAKYDEAVGLIATGDYAAARALFTELGDYKDAAKYLERFHYLPTKGECTVGNDKYAVVVEFDENNMIKKESITKNGEVINENEYTYNDKGQRTKCVNTSSGFVTVIEYVYNEAGYAVEVIEKDGDGTVSTIIKYTHDDQGRVIRSVFESDGNSETYETAFDDKGNVIREVITGSDGSEAVYEYSYTYNEQGQIAERISNGETHTYTYDEKGNLIKYSFPKINLEDLLEGGEMDEYLNQYLSQFPQEYTMSYDENGNNTTLAISYANGDTRSFAFEFKLAYVPFDIDVAADEITTQWFSAISTAIFSSNITPIGIQPE